MRLALLSDIHANLHALQACLQDAAQRGVDQYAFLGDLVGYGGDPAAVVDLVREHVARGAWALRGNHDEFTVHPPEKVERADHLGAAWTRAQLDSGHLAFLGGLPLVHRHEHVFLVHASAHQPERWGYVDDGRSAGASLDAACHDGITHVFGGHVHEQRLFYRSARGAVMPFEPTAGVAIPVPSHRQWLATIGSVGQPRDRRPDAGYALFEVEARRLTFVRVRYDHAAAARAIREAGLPEGYARRLAEGR